MAVLHGIYRCPIGKTLDLNGVARGVEEKHRRLLPRCPGKAQGRLQYKLHVTAQQAFFESVPVGHGQYHAKMRHGHPVLADFPGIANGKRLAQMQRQLMAEKVDIYPALRAAALSTAQHVSVKAPRRDQVVNVIGEMKKRLHSDLLKPEQARWPLRQ